MRLRPAERKLIENNLRDKLRAVLRSADNALERDPDGGWGIHP